MPRNPITYFKTNLMQSLNTSLNDSQNSVVYPIDVQKKIEEVYKRVQAPSNTVNINYNSGNGLPESNIVQKLTQKLSMANEAISNLKKLGNNNEPNKLHSKKVKEIATSDLAKIKEALSPSNENDNEKTEDESRFKQINSGSKSITELIKSIKKSNSNLKEVSKNQNDYLLLNKIDKKNLQVNKVKLLEISKIEKELTENKTKDLKKENLSSNEKINNNHTLINNQNKQGKKDNITNKSQSNEYLKNDKEILIEKSISDSFEKLKMLMSKSSQELDNSNSNKNQVLMTNYNFLKETNNFKLKQIQNIEKVKVPEIENDGALNLDEIL